MRSRHFFIIVCLSALGSAFSGEGPDDDTPWPQEKIIQYLIAKNYTQPLEGLAELLRQPDLKSPDLVDPILNASLENYLKERLFITCIRRQGKPMLDRLQERWKAKEYERTTTGLCALGAEAALVLPDILPVLQGHEHARLACMVMGAIGKEAVPELVKLLADKNRQNEALKALEAMGPDASSAYDPLLKLAKEGSTIQRIGAVNAIAALGPEGKKAVPQLKAWITSGDPCAHSALIAWSHIEPQSSQPSSYFRNLANNQNPTVRSGAVGVLARGRWDQQMVTDYARRFMRDRDPKVIMGMLWLLQDANLAPEERFKLASSHEAQVLKEENGWYKYSKLMAACGPEGVKWIANQVADLMSKIHDNNLYMKDRNMQAKIAHHLQVLRNAGRDAAGAIEVLEKAKAQKPYDNFNSLVRTTITTIKFADWPKEKP